MIISLQELTKVYSSVKALDNISAQIPEGITGLLGPNGAGKTTLLKILLGLIPPTDGHAKIFDLDIRKSKIRIRQLVGYMPEDDNFIPELTPVGYTYLAGRLMGMKHVDAMQRAHSVLHYVGLGEERYREISTLSSGMKQKVKFAQAIVHHPRLLLLDEPTRGLDPKGREEMLLLIKDVSVNKGINVLLSTHILYDVEYTCENIIMLEEGRLIMEGKIDSLKKITKRAYDLSIRGSHEKFCRELSENGFTYELLENGMIRIYHEAQSISKIIFEIVRKNSIQLRKFIPSKTHLEELLYKLYKSS